MNGPENIDLKEIYVLNFYNLLLWNIKGEIIKIITQLFQNIIGTMLSCFNLNK